MRYRFALFVTVLAVFVIAKAPASLLGFGLAAASSNVLRVSDSQGSLWYGRGVLVARDANDRSVTPWLPLGWHFEPAGLLNGELRWSSAAGSGLRGEWSFGVGGFRLWNVAIDAPAAIIFPMFPVSFAHAGWRGDLAVQVPDWRCTWELICEGAMVLQWRGASCTLWPGLRIGDFEILIRGEGSHSRFDVRTLAGELRLSGSGNLAGQGLPTFEGRIGGPPVILKMLPNVAAGVVFPDPAGGLLVLYPARH